MNWSYNLVKYQILSFLLILLFTVSVKAQESNISTIKVIGTYKYEKKIKLYEAYILLNTLFTEDSLSFEQVKTQFIQKLVQNNVDTNKLTDSKEGYLSLVSDMEGTMYIFTTDSYEEFFRFLGIKQYGLQRYGIFVELTFPPESEMFCNAVNDAREIASKFAEIIDKKAGKVLQIENTNILNKYEYMDFYNFFGLMSENEYTVEVVFELINK